MRAYRLSYLLRFRFSNDVGSRNENLHTLPKVQMVSTTMTTTRVRKGPLIRQRYPQQGRTEVAYQRKDMARKDRGTHNSVGQRSPTKEKTRPERTEAPTTGNDRGVSTADRKKDQKRIKTSTK